MSASKMDVASRIMSLTSPYSYKSYNTTCNPYQFKLAHDISVENFQTLQDELSDSSPTKVGVTSSTDSDYINHADPYSKQQPALLESVDLLNQKNAAHSSVVSNGHIKPADSSAVLSAKTGVNGLRIEDVEKIGTDLIRLNIEKTELKKTDVPCFDGAIVVSHRDEDSRSRSPADSDPSTPRQVNKFGSFKKRRKPRKLPEIPVNSHKRRSVPVPAKIPLKELINVSSLADELSAADPSMTPPVMSKSSSFTTSYGANGFLFNGSQECGVDLTDLGSPESVTELPVTVGPPLSVTSTPVVTVAPAPVTQRSQSQSTEEHESGGGGACDKSCCEQRSAASDSMHSSLQTDNSEEFTDLTSEYFEDLPVGSGTGVGGGERPRNLEEHVPVGFNTTSDNHTTRAYLSSANPYLVEDSSPEDKVGKIKGDHKAIKRESNVTQASGQAVTSTNLSNGADDLDATHRGCHKFIPRHSDELFIEIGDPVYVEVEADDLWCEGVNLRTGQRGVFPAAYATDLGFLEENDGTKPYRVNLKFLGSIEVSYHKGYDVLCSAINKVAQTRRMTLNTAPPPVCCLEINEYGIKMTDKSKKRKNKSEEPVSPKKGSFTQRLIKMLSANKDRESKNDHFFSLKNVSFCGYHPKNDKYFAFITKHPLEMRFACHVFFSERSTKCVTEAVGAAFKKFYQEYMAFVHPTEDIYLE